MSKQYRIKITGEGSFTELRNALASVLNEMDLICESDASEPISDIEWEDQTLFTEINKNEE